MSNENSEQSANVILQVPVEDVFEPTCIQIVVRGNPATPALDAALDKTLERFEELLRIRKGE